MADNSHGKRAREELSGSDVSDDIQPPAPKNRTPSGSRFAEPITTPECIDWEKLPKAIADLSQVPKNTEKNDLWALRALTDWISERNQKCEEKCPENILHTEDAADLSKWLSLFVMEVRKKTGEKYPANTIRMMLFGLQRIMRRNKPNAFSIFSPTDARFRGLQTTMETTFQALQEEGVGVEVRHISPIRDSEEDLLWDKGILGDHSPKALLRTVYYLNGINFGLRGGRAHRELKLSNFVRTNDYWEYVDNLPSSKHKGNQIVRRMLGNSKRCHFRLLDSYVSKLPQQARERDAFYYTPVSSDVQFDARLPWYTGAPLGKNKLDRVVAEMFKEAGIEGKTSRSLRLTGAHRMFQHYPERRTEGGSLESEQPIHLDGLVDKSLQCGQSSARIEIVHPVISDQGQPRTHLGIRQNPVRLQLDSLGTAELHQVPVSYRLEAGSLHSQVDSIRAAPATGQGVRNQDYIIHDHLIASARKPIDLTTESSSEQAFTPHSNDELLRSGHFQMPFTIIRDTEGNDNSFREKCERVKSQVELLKKRIDRLESTAQPHESRGYNMVSGVQNEFEIEQLEQRLAEFRDIVQQEELQKAGESAKKDSLSTLLLQRERKLWMEQGKLEAHKEALKEQKEAFELEKQKHLEAVRKLERERQKFEDEKAAFFRNHFHGSSPANHSTTPPTRNDSYSPIK